MNNIKNQEWENVKTKFKIDFRSLPNLPIGVQDQFGGIIENDIIISCGFGCNFNRKNKKPYMKIDNQQFFNNTYKIDLTDTPKGFQKIINFPGIARQGGGSIVVDNKLYCWGGFSYNPTKRSSLKILMSKKTNTLCHKDGYVLYKKNDKYNWDKLPDLPYELCFFSLSNV